MLCSFFQRIIRGTYTKAITANNVLRRKRKLVLMLKVDEDLDYALPPSRRKLIQTMEIGNKNREI